MTTTHDESGDDTTSSLGDSSYDFIDDRSNATTDDEDQDAMTESITSSDGQAFEQVDRYEAGGRTEAVNDPLQARDRPSSNAPHNYQRSDRMLPSDEPGRLALTEPDFPQEIDVIEFDEPSVTNLNSLRFTEVSHTLKMIEKHNAPPEALNDVLDRAQGQIAVTVRQTMTSYSLSPEGGQYKVLYVGPSTIRDSIIQKIGTALATTLRHSTLDPESSRPSKFNVVPISAFGEETSPEVVLIDSSGLELTVEECVTASFARKESGNDSLKLDLSNGTSIESTWTGSKFSISKKWGLPDVAIFCIPDNDNLSSKMTRQFARSFMSRHKVLSITISQSSLWERPATEPTTLDYLAPHICLESRKSSLAQAQIIRRFPIDLATLLNIDAGQMNRNLACLAAAPGSSRMRSQEYKKAAKDILNKNSWSARELYDSLVSDVRIDGLKGLNRYEYIAGFAVMLMSVLGMLVVGFGLTELLGASRVSNSRVFPTTSIMPSTSKIIISTPSSTVIPLALPGSSSVVASSTSSAVPQPSNGKTLSTNTDLASFLLDAYTLAPNKSQQFKVHVLGDCHIVLRPPHWLSKMKKAPKILFKILRKDVELEHQLTTLFDGVYALQIPREDAYGLLNVEVWTENKPVINENFEVDFGCSWLKAAGWKKATLVLKNSVRKDLQLVQTGLSIVYDQTKTGLSTFVRQQKQNVVGKQSAEKARLKSRLKVAARTKELIVAQTRDLQRRFSKRVLTSKAALSTKLMRKAEGFTKDLTVYTAEKSSLILHQAKTFTRAAKATNEAMAHGLQALGKRHLRENQKRALKMWWTMQGVPKQEKGRGKGKVKGRNSKPIG